MLNDKIVNIEKGCASEIISKLMSLRREAVLKVDGPKAVQNDQTLTVD